VYKDRNVALLFEAFYKRSAYSLSLSLYIYIYSISESAEINFSNIYNCGGLRLGYCAIHIEIYIFMYDCIVLLQYIRERTRRSLLKFKTRNIARI